MFIQENAFENVVWKMAVILSPPLCVDKCLCIKNDLLQVVYKGVYQTPISQC